MKSRSMESWSVADKNWLAGLLDGGGSIVPDRRPSHGVRLVFRTKNYEVAARAAALLGVAASAPSPSGFAAAVEGNPACQALIRLRPHVSPRRQAEIDAALESR